MNRRNFFKVVTGFVAGIFATSAKSKPQPKALTCGGKNGTLCPRCKFNDCKDIPSMSAGDWVDAQFNPVKELQLGEPFEGKVVSMINFQGNLWIATERDVYRIRAKFS